jgi:hypothetical protein
VIAYKLLRLRKDGSLGPLFINKKQKIPVGVRLNAEVHKTKGFAFRPGWHCMAEPKAPHLSNKGRVWAKVWIEDFDQFRRPQSQGGKWYLSKDMRVLEILG